MGGRRIPGLLAILVLLAATIGPVPPTTGATPANRAVIDSQLGEYIGGGQSITLTGNEVQAYWVGPELWVRLGVFDAALRVPEGQPFGPGTYVDVGPDAPWLPEVRFWGDGNGCNGNAGRFIVHEAPVTAADGVAVTQFAVDIEHKCEDHPDNSVIAIRVASAVPIRIVRTAFPLPTPGDPPGPSSIVGVPTPARTLSVVNPGDAAVSISRLSLHGAARADFAISSDGCTGTTLAPAGTCQVGIVFTPSATLSRVATVQVHFNGPLDHRSQWLFGYGISPLTLKPHRLLVVSEPGDPIGAGGTWLYDPAGEPGHDWTYPNNVLIGWAGWLVHVIADPLVPGVYPNASDTSGPVLPYLDLNGNSTGCNGSTGWFYIRSGPIFETDGSKLLSMAIDVRQRCAGATGELRASFRYHSDIPPIVDTTAPVVGLPWPSIVAGTVAGPTAVPVRLGWWGSDPGSGIYHYDLDSRSDGGPWAAVRRGYTSTGIVRNLEPTHGYRFRLRATDRIGNSGTWAEGPSFRVEAAAQDGPGTSRTGSWSTITSPYHRGGTALRASTAGATLTYTFQGRSVGWIAPTGPGSGTATVLIDGVAVGSVNLWSPTARFRQIVFARSWPAVGSHTLTIQVTGGPVDVDGFAVVR